MSESVETVTVKGEDGNSLIINRSDYDAAPKNYTLFDATGAAPVAAAPVAPSGAVLVSKEGKRFYLTDDTGARLSGDGIADAGYATDKEAWDVALTLKPAA